MSTNNPISGHTDGTNDGLKDGDHILSPSLTNLYEGVHGNGILLPHDTAYGDSDRNDPPDLPGSISAGAAANQFVVKACDVILDGVLYAIGGGSDITVTLNLTGTAEMLGSFTALSSGQECLFVVIATPDGLKVSQTTNITTAVGAYPSITGSATAYLKTGSGAGDNRQSVVLGTVRATNAGGSTVGTLNIESLSEFNDKRVFVRPTPLYLSPVRDGTISSTTGINGHTALSQVHTGQTGTFGDNGIIWQSFNSDGESMLYYSAKAGANRHTHLLGPTNIDVSSPGSNQTFTFDGDRVFVLTPSTTINLNPSGTFPPGHSVFVSVPSGSTVTFDSTGLNQAITAGDAIMFAYDGTNWKRVLFSSTVATTSSGTSGLVQLSDGAGGFTSDSTLSYDTAANELTVDGKLTVTGLIDPTGLELTPQTSNPAAADAGVVDANTLWLDDNDSDRLKHGALSVMRENDDISELNNDAGFVDAAGAAAAAPSTDLAYDAGTRTVSSSTGTNAVITEVVAGGDSGLMTGADKTKLDGVAPSATAYADADAVAAVETEAGLDFSTSSNDAIVENTAQDKDIIFKINDGGTPTEVLRIDGSTGNVGIRLNQNVTADERLDVEDGNISLTTTDRTTERVLKLRNSGSTTSLSEIAMAGANSNNFEGYIAFKTKGPSDLYNDPLNEVMRIDGNKKVGIGETAPSADLHIKSSANFDPTSAINTATLILEQAGGTQADDNESVGMTFTKINSGRPFGSIAGVQTGSDADVGGLAFFTHDATISTDIISEKMRIDGNGNVGIGTTSPSAELHIEGASNPTIRVQETGQTGHAELTAVVDSQARLKAINNTASEPVTFDISPVSTATGTEQLLRIFRDSDTSVDGNFRILRVGTTDSVLHVYSDKDGTDHKMTMDGNVGIGTTSPAQALDVTGTIRQSAVTSAVLVADSNGDLTAASTLADVAYVLSGQAGADVYNPANPANWVGAPPLTIEQAIQRIAAVVAGQHGAIP